MAAAFLLAVSFAMYGRALLPGRIMSTGELLFHSHPWKVFAPHRVKVDPILNDLVFQFHPWMALAKREVSAGRFPLWNPFAYCGSPLLGNAQSGLLSPFNALAFFLPLGAAVGLAAVLKTAVAGVSMYWFLRLLSMGIFPALAGALAFMFSGFITAWLAWPVAGAAVWLPALFAAFETLRRDGTWRSAALVALVTCLHLLGGHPETSFQMTVAAAAWCIYRARGEGWARFLLLAAAGSIAGVLMAGVQILPFIEYLFLSATVSHRTQGFLETVIRLKGAILFLVPRWFGHPGQGTAWEPAISSDYNEVSGTVGILPLVLAPCALLGARVRRPAVFFAVLAAACFGIIYHEPGLPFTSFLPRLYSLVPGLSLVPHRRLLLLLDFGLSILGAMGMQTVMAPDRRVRRGTAVAVLLVPAALIAIMVLANAVDMPRMIRSGSAMATGHQMLIAVALMAAAAFTARRMIRGGLARGGPLMLLAAGLLSLAPFASTYIPVMRLGDLYPETPALSFLKGDRSVFRVLMPSPNVGAVYGLQDILGYDGMNPRAVTDLTSSPESLGFKRNDPSTFTHGFDSPLLDVMNVKYLLLPPSGPAPGGKYELVYEGMDARVYRNTRVVPRAVLVPAVRRFRDEGAVLEAVLAGRVDFRPEVALATGESENPETRAQDAATGTAGITRYASDSLEVKTSSDVPAWLFLSDAWFPGWLARVDGRGTPLLRANHAFRAVRIPAGKHRVEFIYQPVSFRAGMLLSTLGLLAMLAMAARGRPGGRLREAKGRRKMRV